MKEHIHLTRILIFLFIVLTAVSAQAQTPLRPILPPRKAETRADSLPEQSTDQAEASEDTSPDDSHLEDSPPDDSAGQTEASEDSFPAHTAGQSETSEDSPFEDAAGQTEVSEDSLPAHPVEKADFFIAPLAELIGYSWDNVSIGAGFAIGAGNGIAIGARFLYAVDPESIHTMEIAVFMRAYLRGAQACTGSFIQLNAGASIYNHEHVVSLPAKVGALSAGIAVGWRLPLGQRTYIEYYVRAGYPYIYGGGVAFAFKL